MARTFLIRDGGVVINRSSGGPVMVSGAEKARQDVANMLGTEFTPDDIGASLDTIVGSVPQSPAQVRQLIRARVTRAFNTLLSLQKRFNRRSRSSVETFSRLANVTASTTASDPTAYVFRVDVTTVAGGTISFGGRLN